MGVEFKKCTIIRDVKSGTQTGIVGIDYDNTEDSTKKVIIKDYLVKIKDYNGSVMTAGNGGITYGVGTKAYGLYHTSEIKTGDKIILIDEDRTFRVKSPPVKGLSYSVMDVVEI